MSWLIFALVITLIILNGLIIFFLTEQDLISGKQEIELYNECLEGKKPVDLKLDYYCERAR